MSTTFTATPQHPRTPVLDAPAPLGVTPGKPALGDLPGIPTAIRRPDARERSGHSLKRALDVTVCLLLLILLALVMGVIAAAVKLTSSGPVFFLQQRVGRDGRSFNVIKFRSMRVGTHAEVLRDAVENRRYQENGFKLDARDPRITGLGRFMRATSLDELPQLFNVLRGDMSLVGIRPLLAQELELRENYDQLCYTSLRPGMTGLWQVSGRSSTSTVDRHELDRCYIETWSFENDLKVLLRTPLALLRTSQTS